MGEYLTGLGYLNGLCIGGPCRGVIDAFDGSKASSLLREASGVGKRWLRRRRSFCRFPLELYVNGRASPRLKDSMPAKRVFSLDVRWVL